MVSNEAGEPTAVIVPIGLWRGMATAIAGGKGSCGTLDQGSRRKAWNLILARSRIWLGKSKTIALKLCSRRAAAFRENHSRGSPQPAPVAAMVAVLLPPAKLRLAQAARTQRDTKVGDLCPELGITRQTLYRFVGPKGELRAA